MAAAYLERANQVKSLTDVTQFISSYAEVSRVFRYLEGSTAQAAQRVFDLYKRHATEVTGALDELVSRNITAIRERTLPGDCLLRTVYESGSVISVPTVASAEKMPDNIFRKRGGVWEARFQGRNTIFLLSVDKGAEYINLLLAFPNRETLVSEIVFGCALGAAEAAANTGLDHDDIDEGIKSLSGFRLGMLAWWPTQKPSNSIVIVSTNCSGTRQRQKKKATTSDWTKFRTKWHSSRRRSVVQLEKAVSPESSQTSGKTSAMRSATPSTGPSSTSTSTTRRWPST